MSSVTRKSEMPECPKLKEVDNIIVAAHGNSLRGIVKHLKGISDKASGIRNGAFKVRLYAVTDDAAAKVVYTTDGTDPTAQSTAVASGTEITVSDDCTLKVGILSAGKVKGSTSSIL